MKIDNQESLLGQKDEDSELSYEKISYTKVFKDSFKTFISCLVSHCFYPVMSIVNVLILSRQYGTIPLAGYALGSLS